MRTDSAQTPRLVAGAPAIRSLLGGRYQLLGLLREGSGGVVHRARDVRLEREVAISFLARERERSPGRESVETTIALAEHPRVVTVHDIGEDEGRVFLVSEMMAGTLRVALADGAREALPADRALR